MADLRLAGPKEFLLGPAGSGKSYAIGTLVDWCAAHDFSVHVVYTENSLETLLGYWLDKGQEIPKCLRWHVNLVPTLPLATLQKAAKDAGMLSYEQLTKLVDPDRTKNNPWEKFLTLFTDVPDDRTGQKFGNIGNWTNKQFLVIDSGTEAANACFRMVTGSKPTAAPPEYQVAQNNYLSWLRFMTQSLQCGMVVTGHPQRQQNEITGSQTVQISAIGKALGDEIPRLFSEVIWCKNEPDGWWWDTAAFAVDTKIRYLPKSAKIKPDFAQVMDKWLKRASV